MKPENLITFKDGKKVIMDGPLSRVFTEALNDLYEKEIEPVSGLVLESQIFQAMQQAQTFLEANKAAQDIKDSNIGMLYAVDSTETIVDDLAKLATSVSTMTNNQVRNSAVIVNKTNEEEVDKPINFAIEEFCKAVNIPFYTSLNSYMKSKKGK